MVIWHTSKDYLRLKNPSSSCTKAVYVFYYFYHIEQVAAPSLPLKFLAVRRHHVHLASLQKVFKTAVEKACITKNAPVHTVASIFDIAPS